MTLTLTRRAVRHYVMRRRNERITKDPTATDWPVELVMHPDSLDDVLIDDDPDERFTVGGCRPQPDGRHTILGIPMRGDPSIEPGLLTVRWR